MKNGFFRIRHTEVSESVQWKKTVAFKICSKLESKWFGIWQICSEVLAIHDDFQVSKFHLKKMMSMLDSYDI